MKKRPVVRLHQNVVRSKAANHLGEHLWIYGAERTFAAADAPCLLSCDSTVLGYQGKYLLN
jgi:hypothetical protein